MEKKLSISADTDYTWQSVIPKTSSRREESKLVYHVAILMLKKIQVESVESNVAHVERMTARSAYWNAVSTFTREQDECLALQDGLKALPNTDLFKAKAEKRCTDVLNKLCAQVAKEKRAVQDEFQQKAEEEKKLLEKGPAHVFNDLAAKTVKVQLEESKSRKQRRMQTCPWMPLTVIAKSREREV